MIQKIRRITEIIIAVVVLTYAVLYMFKWNNFAFVMPYVFLITGLIYFIVEFADRQPKKPFVRMVLLIVPLILIAFSIKIILSGPVSSTFLTFLLLTILMSSLPKRLSTSDQKS